MKDSSRRRIAIAVTVALSIAIVAVAVGVVLSSSAAPDRPGTSSSAEVEDPEAPALRPTRSPTSAPTPVPTAAPTTDRPSSRPSDSPSAVPTMRPTTAAPTPRPTPAPTRPPKIDPNWSFRLRLYWKAGYFWQEEAGRKEWCLECARCGGGYDPQNGDGCNDSQKDKADCRRGDRLWLQRCQGKGSAVFRARPSPNRWGQYLIEARGTGLCLERAGSREIVLDRCDSNSDRQLWYGLEKGAPFDLHPFGRFDQCVSQHHHPKANEVVYAEDCVLAHKAKTGLWEAI